MIFQIGDLGKVIQIGNIVVFIFFLNVADAVTLKFLRNSIGVFHNIESLVRVLSPSVVPDTPSTLSKTVNERNEKFNLFIRSANEMEKEEMGEN